jgi:hypothetical protein
MNCAWIRTPEIFLPSHQSWVNEDYWLVCVYPWSEHSVTYSRYAWHPLPRQRWCNKRCRCYGNGQVNTPPLPSPRWRGSDSHCDVTRDTDVDSDNSQPATGNRHQYKKPTGQHVELVCDQEWHSVNEEVTECSCSEWIGNVKNTDCMISSDRVWIVKSQSPVKSSSYELSCIVCMADLHQKM